MGAPALANQPAAHAATPLQRLSLKLIARTGLRPGDAVRAVDADRAFGAMLGEAGYRLAPAGGPCRLWHDASDYLACAAQPQRRAYAAALEAAVEPGGWAIIACEAGARDGLAEVLGWRFRGRETHHHRRVRAVGETEQIELNVFERVA